MLECTEDCSLCLTHTSPLLAVKEEMSEAPSLNRGTKRISRDSPPYAAPLSPKLLRTEAHPSEGIPPTTAPVLHLPNDHKQLLFHFYSSVTTNSSSMTTDNSSSFSFSMTTDSPSMTSYSLITPPQ